MEVACIYIEESFVQLTHRVLGLPSWLDGAINNIQTRLVAAMLLFTQVKIREDS